MTQVVGGSSHYLPPGTDSFLYTSKYEYIDFVHALVMYSEIVG